TRAEANAVARIVAQPKPRCLGIRGESKDRHERGETRHAHHLASRNRHHFLPHLVALAAGGRRAGTPTGSFLREQRTGSQARAGVPPGRRSSGPTRSYISAWSCFTVASPARTVCSACARPSGPCPAAS